MPSEFEENKSAFGTSSQGRQGTSGSPGFAGNIPQQGTFGSHPNIESQGSAPNPATFVSQGSFGSQGKFVSQGSFGVTPNHGNLESQGKFGAQTNRPIKASEHQGSVESRGTFGTHGILERTGDGISTALKEYDDEPDESLSERLWGLTEMFPDKVRNCTHAITTKTWCGVKTLYGLSRTVMWVIASSSVILFAPVIFEVERAQVEEMQKSQQKQVLLGTNTNMPPMPR